MGKAKEIIFQKFPKITMGVLLLCAVVINVANVVSRHVFKSSIVWAEEVLIFMLIWIVFIGAVSVTINNVHLKMDFLSMTFSARVSKAFQFASNLLTIGMGVLVVYASSTTIIPLWKYKQLSVVAEIPMYIPHMAIPIGFGLIAILMTANIIADLISKKH